MAYDLDAALDMYLLIRGNNNMITRVLTWTGHFVNCNVRYYFFFIT